MSKAFLRSIAAVAAVASASGFAWAAAGDLKAGDLLRALPPMPASAADALRRAPSDVDTALEGAPGRPIDRLKTEADAITRAQAGSAQNAMGAIVTPEMLAQRNRDLSPAQQQALIAQMVQNAMRGAANGATANSYQAMPELAKCIQDMGSDPVARNHPAAASTALERFDAQIDTIRDSMTAALKRCPTNASGFATPECERAAQNGVRSRAMAAAQSLPGTMRPIMDRWAGTIRTYGPRCESPAHANLSNPAVRSSALGTLAVYNGWVHNYVGTLAKVTTAMAKVQSEFAN